MSSDQAKESRDIGWIDVWLVDGGMEVLGVEHGVTVSNLGVKLLTPAIIWMI